MDGSLRALFRKNLSEFDWLAVETGARTGRGVPDSNCCKNGVECWVEFKKTRSWRIIISAEQVGWAERRARHGGRVILAVRRCDKELWIFPGSAMRLLRSSSMRDVPALEVYQGGPSAWDWEEIGMILMVRWDWGGDCGRARSLKQKGNKMT